MEVCTIVDEVVDGAITGVTLSVDGVVNCRFSISESGENAVFKECHVLDSSDEKNLNEAFQEIFTTLKQNGVVAINTEGGSLPIQLGRL